MGCLVPFYPDEDDPDCFTYVDEYDLYERICCRDLFYDQLSSEEENLSKMDKNDKSLQEVVREKREQELLQNKTVSNETENLFKEEEINILPTRSNSDKPVHGTVRGIIGTEELTLPTSEKSVQETLRPRIGTGEVTLPNAGIDDPAYGTEKENSEYLEKLIPSYPARSIKKQPSSTVHNEIKHVVETLCQFPNDSIGDRAWCKLALDEPTITFKDVAEWYTTKSQIADELGLNIITLETIGLPFITILNVIKYAHFLQEGADVRWHDPTTWLPAAYTTFCDGMADLYLLPDDRSSPPSTPGQRR